MNKLLHNFQFRFYNSSIALTSKKVITIVRALVKLSLYVFAENTIIIIVLK